MGFTVFKMGKPKIKMGNKFKGNSRPGKILSYLK